MPTAEVSGMTSVHRDTLSRENQSFAGRTTSMEVIIYFLFVISTKLASREPRCLRIQAIFADTLTKS